MKHHITRRRKDSYKKKIFHRRGRTCRRGGRAMISRNRSPNNCEHYLVRLRNFEEDLDNQTAITIEDFSGDVRSFYNEVAEVSRRNLECQYILNYIDIFENGRLKDKMDILLGN
jgi:hypothetical protein